MFDLLKKTELGIKRSKETWFSKIANVFNRGSFGDEVWGELEELLISADVGVETTNKLLSEVRQRVKMDRLSEVSQIREALKKEMVGLLSIPSSRPSTSCYSGCHEESPRIILVVGVNGSGKTTSIAKLAYDLTSQGKRVILAAGDTFRAAAIDQLKHWGDKTGAEVIAHQPGGDPGAVAYDAVQAGYSRHAQVVIIDTAGRLHTKFNLMEELKKIRRVVAKQDASAPHQVLLVMDATTGQNGLAQAKHFTEAVNVTDVFLAKLDGTARGGIVFAICDQLNIPISYIGTGEKLQDVAPFDAEVFVNAIFS
ncbi:MAG: signal recognition particle-docking protein FtsY [Dehalococcoidia bacterium]|nr:signal recognition particle-docking protein FtsY [Dehalococcoidia bacterium]MDH4300126.1 signal recognition particle-docking protein FtsY [Dehalococcoidia bacterium]MDH4368115.1 signal recognition particle-docking protein FtsY [Dehalococcoidia bacterium]